jgi:hypothetical protein
MPSLILGGLCAMAVSASCYGAIGYLHQKRIATDEYLAVERANQTNAELQTVIARLSDQIEDVQGGIDALADGLAGEIAKDRDQLVRQRDELEKQSAQLEQQIAHAQAVVASANLREPSSVAAAVTGWMREARYPEAITHAFLDRVKQESGFNPQAVSPGGAFKCLVQWDLQRYRNLLRFARFTPSRHNLCPPWYKQMEFVHHELTTVPQYRVVWTAGRNAYNMVTAAYFGGAQ